ncbi:hypothetical protein DFH11DRAFT_1287688 [Phellopilus nigrolimitatus]|nr:hypothetical protein DFH11DRAFT_1287688 [Phellopilus nigrolimitatus]
MASAKRNSMGRGTGSVGGIRRLIPMYARMPPAHRTLISTRAILFPRTHLRSLLHRSRIRLLGRTTPAQLPGPRTLRLPSLRTVVRRMLRGSISVTARPLVQDQYVFPRRPVQTYNSRFDAKYDSSANAHGGSHHPGVALRAHDPGVRRHGLLGLCVCC